MDVAVLHNERIHLRELYNQYIQQGYKKEDVSHLLKEKYQLPSRQRLLLCVGCEEPVELVLPQGSRGYFRHYSQHECVYSRNKNQYEMKMKQEILDPYRVDGDPIESWNKVMDEISSEWKESFSKVEFGEMYVDNPFDVLRKKMLLREKEKEFVLEDRHGIDYGNMSEEEKNRLDRIVSKRIVGEQWIKGNREWKEVLLVHYEELYHKREATLTELVNVLKEIGCTFEQKDSLVHTVITSLFHLGKKNKK